MTDQILPPIWKKVCDQTTHDEQFTEGLEEHMLVNARDILSLARDLFLPLPQPQTAPYSAVPLAFLPPLIYTLFNTLNVFPSSSSLLAL